MNTKTLNTYEKLWLANRASHNMALAGPTAFWLASGHRATGKPDPCSPHTQFHWCSSEKIVNAIIYSLLKHEAGFAYSTLSSFCHRRVKILGHANLLLHIMLALVYTVGDKDTARRHESESSHMAMFNVDSNYP